MLRIKITLLCFVGALFSGVFAQKCTVKISDEIASWQKHSPKKIEAFLTLAFEFNHVNINATDRKNVHIPILDKGFDTVVYSYMYKGVIYRKQFICKLRAKETYTISPCECCGVFLMVPEQNARRGSVKYMNHSTQTFISESGEFELDTLYKNSDTDFIQSSISMNCGFRPNQLFVADLDYLNPKYQYDQLKLKSESEQELLDKEQLSLIRFSFNFLFLHEEKLLVSIDETGLIFTVELE
jgi:hypothetical protein